MRNKPWQRLAGALVALTLSTPALADQCADEIGKLFKLVPIQKTVTARAYTDAYESRVKLFTADDVKAFLERFPVGDCDVDVRALVLREMAQLSDKKQIKAIYDQMFGTFEQGDLPGLVHSMSYVFENGSGTFAYGAGPNGRATLPRANARVFVDPAALRVIASLSDADKKAYAALATTGKLEFNVVAGLGALSYLNPSLTDNAKLDAKFKTYVESLALLVRERKLKEVKDILAALNEIVVADAQREIAKALGVEKADGIKIKVLSVPEQTMPRPAFADIDDAAKAIAALLGDKKAFDDAVAKYLATLSESEAKMFRKALDEAGTYVTPSSMRATLQALGTKLKAAVGGDWNRVVFTTANGEGRSQRHVLAAFFDANPDVPVERVFFTVKEIADHLKAGNKLDFDTIITLDDGAMSGSQASMLSVGALQQVAAANEAAGKSLIDFKKVKSVIAYAFATPKAINDWSRLIGTAARLQASQIVKDPGFPETLRKLTEDLASYQYLVFADPAEAKRVLAGAGPYLEYIASKVSLVYGSSQVVDLRRTSIYDPKNPDFLSMFPKPGMGTLGALWMYYYMAPDNNAASNAPDYVFWKFVNELIWDAERNKAHKNPSDGVSPWEDNTGE